MVILKMIFTEMAGKSQIVRSPKKGGAQPSRLCSPSLFDIKKAGRADRSTRPAGVL